MVAVDALFRAAVMDAARPLSTALRTLYVSPLWAKAWLGISVNYSDDGARCPATFRRISGRTCSGRSRLPGGRLGDIHPTRLAHNPC